VTNQPPHLALRATLSPGGRPQILVVSALAPLGERGGGKGAMSLSSEILSRLSLNCRAAAWCEVRVNLPSLQAFGCAFFNKNKPEVYRPRAGRRVV
jgi:hypothetical protein